MKRCGDDVLHDEHVWHDKTVDYWQACDGRTRNEPMVGQLTVAELRAALDGEQDGALVAVDLGTGVAGPLALIPTRTTGLPVFMVRLWQS